MRLKHLSGLENKIWLRFSSYLVVKEYLHKINPIFTKSKKNLFLLHLNLVSYRKVSNLHFVPKMLEKYCSLQDLEVFVPR